MIATEGEIVKKIIPSNLQAGQFPVAWKVSHHNLELPAVEKWPKRREAERQYHGCGEHSMEKIVV